jgi:predicted glycosyltransferase
MTLRFLFHCRNTTGLGHLMRGRNIATALRQIDPSADIAFTGNPESFAPFLGEFPYLPDLSGEDVARLRPDVLIFDTLLPPWPVPADTALVYVMRKIRPQQRDRFLNDPLLEKTALILIPHTREDYPDDLPSHLQDKACWVGPIVRTPGVEAQGHLRAKYDIEEGEFVLTSTAGGGGRPESAFFFDTIAEVHRRLHASIPRFRHFAVAGPYCTRVLPALEGLTALRFEPAINDLFGLSNLVIAEGGYNTVHEVLMARVPAVFLPAARKLDDQEERVRALERDGLCAVFAGRSSDAVEGIVDMCLTRSRVDQMKANATRLSLQPANLTAAAKLLEVATRVRSARTRHD